MVVKWISSLSCLNGIVLILQAGFVNDLMREAGKKSILGTASLLITDGKASGPSTNKCCRIEDLSLENGSIDDSDNMIPMAVFSAIMLRIKGFREEYKINHLVMSEAQTFRRFVNFLGPAGFQECTCDPFGAAGPELQKCLPWPIPYTAIKASNDDRRHARTSSTVSRRPAPSLKRKAKDSQSTSTSQDSA